MRNGKRLKSFAYSIGTGIFAVFLFVLFYLAANKNVAPFMLIIREVFPLYGDGPYSVINLYTYTDVYEDAYDAQTYDGIDTEYIPAFETLPEDIMFIEPESSLETETSSGLIGINNVVYQPETDLGANDNPQIELLTKADFEKFKDFDYLKSALYTVDKRTALLPQDIDLNAYINMDFNLSSSIDGPKALILHTHSQEGYADSRKGDITDGVFAVGDKLAELLNDKYGVETLHDKTSYDIVDGVSSTLGAYERMEESITKILERYPSIELIIDLHRDGVTDDLHFVTEINGKPTAKIMFFNGLCRVYSNGELVPTNGLVNDYIKDNLAFSLDLQLLANELFPGFTRKIYINAYRYSLHFKPKSILVEVGAQTNTKEEALNAMEPLAEILNEIINK